MKEKMRVVGEMPIKRGKIKSKFSISQRPDCVMIYASCQWQVTPFLCVTLHDKLWSFMSPIWERHHLRG